MGYAMTYQRVVNRNQLQGNYTSAQHGREGAVAGFACNIAGDMRRLERDQTDAFHLALYARHVGITPEQVLAVLRLFLYDRLPDGTYLLSGITAEEQQILQDVDKQNPQGGPYDPSSGA